MLEASGFVYTSGTSIHHTGLSEPALPRKELFPNTTPDAALPAAQLPLAPSVRTGLSQEALGTVEQWLGLPTSPLCIKTARVVCQTRVACPQASIPTAKGKYYGQLLWTEEM